MCGVWLLPLKEDLRTASRDTESLWPCWLLPKLGNSEDRRLQPDRKQNHVSQLRGHVARVRRSPAAGGGGLGADEELGVVLRGHDVAHGRARPGVAVAARQTRLADRRNIFRY